MDSETTTSGPHAALAPASRPSFVVGAVLVVLMILQTFGACSSDGGAPVPPPVMPDASTRVDCTDASPCATCEASGTGNLVGDVIADQSWPMDVGGDLALHRFCGVRRGVLIIETATWCTLCTERLPLMQQWIAQYQPLGVEFVFLLGENQNAAIPTEADLKAYRSVHALQASIYVAGDPKWTSIKKTVLHSGGVGTLPGFVLLDEAMKLVYTGDGGDKALFPQVSDALGTLTGSPFVATRGCDGFCGKLAPGGCWCDDLCAQLGNCCEDNCGVCGYCP